MLLKKDGLLLIRRSFLAPGATGIRHSLKKGSLLPAAFYALLLQRS
jgi:hypothetical protein